MSIADAVAMHVIGALLTFVWLCYKDLFCKQPLTGESLIWLIVWPCYWMIVFCEYMNLIDKEE